MRNSCSISKTSDISFNCVVQYVTVETTYQNLDMLKHQCYEFQHRLCPYIDHLLCYWYLVNVDASFCRCEFKMTTTFIMNAALILLMWLNKWLNSCPSVLWHCWLDVMKSIRPVNIERRDVDMVICLERGADYLHMIQLMPLHPKPRHLLPRLNPDFFYLSCICLPFLYLLTQVVRVKRPLNRCSRSSWLNR